MTTRYAFLAFTTMLIPIMASGEAEIVEAQKPSASSVGNAAKPILLGKDAKPIKEDKANEKAKEKMKNSEWIKAKKEQEAEKN